MSDFDEFLQPQSVPILGTDATYTDPGEAWDATPPRAEMSAGALAQGLLPGTDLDAQTLNDLLGRIGQGLATIMDSAAVTWEPHDFPSVIFRNSPVWVTGCSV